MPMAIKLKIPTSRSGGKRGKNRLLSHDPIVRFALLAFLSISLVVVGFFAFWYVKYDRIIEQRFRGPVFASSAKIFAAPQVVKVGSKQTVSEIAAELRHAGYSEKEGESPLGSYRVHGGSIEIQPGPESYHS
ncbi:MAG: penicillin-binding protein, partial [Terriglobales bacterium]